MSSRASLAGTPHCSIPPHTLRQHTLNQRLLLSSEGTLSMAQKPPRWPLIGSISSEDRAWTGE